MRDENGSKYRLAPCAAKLSGPTKKTYFDAITDLVDFFVRLILCMKRPQSARADLYFTSDGDPFDKKWRCRSPP